MMRDVIVVFIIGYLLGNIQASYVLGKLIYKVDIRTLGHGNAGASNAMTSFGFKFGLLVAFVDVAKGLMTILIIRYFYHVGFNPEEALLLYVGALGVILGHNFPVFMGFKGGKGTASLLGVLLGINPVYGIGGILLIIIVTIITDRVALSAGVLVLSFLGLTLIKQMDIWAILIGIVLVALSIYKHIPNYKRIITNEEGRLSTALAKTKKKKEQD
jgi:glycerol-3-phosphate acyltransferase PlsY